MSIPMSHFLHVFNFMNGFRICVVMRSILVSRGTSALYPNSLSHAIFTGPYKSSLHWVFFSVTVYVMWLIWLNMSL
jgi:hypothetical protein